MSTRRLIPRALTIGGFLTLATLSGGCTVGPDFRRPDTAGPDAYTRESLDKLALGGQQLVPGGSPAALWWSVFGSEALDATIRQALAGNRTLASARASLAAAQEAVNASSGALVPQVGLNAGAGREKYGAQFAGSLVFSPFTYYAVGPSVSYLFDYTGGQHRAVEQKQALADYQQYQLQAAYLSLTGNVAREVLAMASGRAQLDALEMLLADDRQNLTLVQTAFEAGSVTRVDVLSAESQLANDRTLLPPLRQQLSVARHALSILAGRAPADWQPPEFKLNELRLPQELPVSLPSELVHHRPDILAAESQLHAATAAVGVATAALYPQITLTASVGQQSTQLSQLFDHASISWGLAGGLTAPLFDGGTLRAQRRQAQDQMQAALANYEQSVLQSFGQVADVLTALDHDAEELSAQKNALDSALASLNLTRESYKVGNVGVLQVLDAERQYQQAQLGFVRVQAQRYLDTVQLFLALGGNAPGLNAVSLASEFPACLRTGRGPLRPGPAPDS
jgi:NodT family efflux transporter outer membrane factor (OMF) lipoprotein